MPTIALYRVLAVLAGAILFVSVVAPFDTSMLGGVALAAPLLSRMLGRQRRWRLFRGVLRLGLVSTALIAAAGTEVGMRPSGVMAELARITAEVGANADRDRPQLWLGRITGIPFPVPDGTEAHLALAGRLGGAGLEPVRGRIVVSFPDRTPEPGEWWLVRGVIVVPEPRRNPGGIDARGRAERLGWAGRMTVVRASAARRLASRPSLAARPDLALATGIGVVRARVHHALAARMAAETAGLAEAMSLGMRGSLWPETGAAFRALGWSHLIAVSGMNVGFVAGLAAAGLGIFRVRWRSPVLALVMVAYGVVTGGEPPVMRAVVMGLAALLARATERALPTGRSLVLAAFLSLAAAPRWIEDAGFQLSFAAIAGMALLGPRIDWSHPLAWLAGRTRLARFVVLPLWTGFAAQVGCLPILAETFHCVSPWGVITGPVAIPHSGIFVSALLLGMPLLALPGPLGAGLLSGAAVLGEALIAGSRLGARHLAAPWPVPPPGPLPIAALVLGVCGVSLLRGRPGPRAVAALVAVAAGMVILCGLPPPGGPVACVEVVFLDVRQGDAILVVGRGAPGWERHLGLRRRPRCVFAIDAGDAPPEGLDSGARIVAPAVAALGARGIDAFIASHGDRDHVGGLPGLAHAMSIEEIFWPAPYEPPRAILALTAEDGGKRSRLKRAAAGDTLLALPGLVVRALHPPRDYGGDENNGSLVVLIEAPGTRVLLAGDIEAEGESVLCAEGGTLRADVVKVPHHGSATSSGAELVAATHARHAVVSVGRRNRFGHPDPAVLARWGEAGARVWRTDQEGAVIARIERGRVGVRCTVGEPGST